MIVDEIWGYDGKYMEVNKVSVTVNKICDSRWVRQRIEGF
jgi:hypothetical protein